MPIIGPFGMVVGVMGLFKEMVVETAKVFVGSDRQPDGRYGRINRATGMPSRAKPPGNGIPTPGVDFTIVDPDRQVNRETRQMYDRVIGHEYSDLKRRATRKHRRG